MKKQKSKQSKQLSESTNTLIISLISACLFFFGTTVFLFFNQKTSEEKIYLSLIPWAMASQLKNICTPYSEEDPLIQPYYECLPLSYGISEDGDPYILFEQQAYQFSEPGNSLSGIKTTGEPTRAKLFFQKNPNPANEFFNYALAINWHITD